MNITILDKSVEGGTGSFIINLLKIKKYLKNSNINVLVLERPSLRGIYSQQFTYFRSQNFYPKYYSPTVSNLLNFLQEFIWLKRNIIKYKTDIIISVDLRSNLLAILNKLFIFRKLKVIATTQISGSVFDNSILYILVKNFVKIVYEQADVLVCCSKLLAKSVKNYFNLKTTPLAIYPGANFNKNLPKTFNKGKNKIVISVARLSEQKDHVNLLNAFKELVEDLPYAKLWLVSDGPKRQELESIVKKYKLTKNVKFLGWVNDVYEHLRKSDIFVLSSKKEGFAYVLIEAMSCGIPVISTDTPHGPREVLGGGRYGILVPVSDPDKLKESMFEALTNKSLYEKLVSASLKRSGDFSVDKMLRHYTKIIKRLS